MVALERRYDTVDNERSQRWNSLEFSLTSPPPADDEIDEMMEPCGWKYDES